MSERPTGTAARGADFFAVDGELSEEERLTRDTVRAFVNERALPILDQAFVNDPFPFGSRANRRTSDGECDGRRATRRVRPAGRGFPAERPARVDGLPVQSAPVGHPG